jgi:peptide/nickel transport system substrate-binding protein
MVGTGPYKFMEWIPGDRIVYTRNDEYWGEKPEWEKVIVKPISNSSARVAAVLAGDVDLIDFVPTADIEKLNKNPKLTMERSVSNRLIYLHIDSNRDVYPLSPILTATR